MKEIARTRVTVSIQYKDEPGFTNALEIVSDSNNVLHPAQQEYGIVLESLFQGVRELVGVRGGLDIQYDHKGGLAYDPDNLMSDPPTPECKHDWVIKEGGLCICSKCNASLRR